MAPSIRWDLLSDLSCVDRTPVSGMKQRLRVSSTRRGNPIAGSAAPDGRSHPGTVTRAKRAGMMLTCRWSPASVPCPGPLKAHRRTGRRKRRSADSKHPCFLGAWVILGEQWRPAGRAGRIWGSVSMPQAQVPSQLEPRTPTIPAQHFCEHAHVSQHGDSLPVRAPKEGFLNHGLFCRTRNRGRPEGRHLAPVLHQSAQLARIRGGTGDPS